MCEEEYYREYLKGIVFWINNTLQSPNIICFGKCFLEGILVFHFNKDIVNYGYFPWNSVFHHIRKEVCDYSEGKQCSKARKFALSIWIV